MTSPKTPKEILGLARNFMESRILISAVELDLFTLLADESMSAADAADQTGYHLRPLTVLLDALAGLGLLVKENGRYRTEESAAPLLSSKSPRSVRPMILHAGTIWHRWSELTPIVRETGGPDRPMAIFENPDDIRSFIGAMHVVGSPQAARIVRDFDPGPAGRLIDVGGATGTYTEAFLDACPNATATLFDRPEVIELARERLEPTGLLDRITLAPGDFYEDDLPGGHDLALLSAIIHQNSRQQNVDLYRKVFDALIPGGRLVIRDHVMQPDRTRPVSGAIFAINMLVGTPGGGTYSFDEIRAGLEDAGFTRVKLLAEGEPMGGLVEAFRPE